MVVETERIRRPDRVFADGGPSPWVSVLHDGGGRSLRSSGVLEGPADLVRRLDDESGGR